MALAAVYSTRFLTLPSFSGGPSAPYNVLAGTLVVVRTISFVWGDVAVSGLDAWVQTADLTKLARRTIVFPGPDPMYIGGCAVFDGRWVLDEGDTLEGQTAAGTCDIHVAGYVLTLP